MKYTPIAAALTISTTGMLLDDISTVIGLSRGFVESNPLYPYSMLVIPLFYFSFLVMLEIVRVKMIPPAYNKYFVLLTIIIALAAFRGFINNALLLY